MLAQTGFAQSPSSFLAGTHNFLLERLHVAFNLFKKKKARRGGEPLEIADKPRFVAAVAAAIATAMGTDVTGLRILSIKKISSGGKRPHAQI